MLQAGADQRASWPIALGLAVLTFVAFAPALSAGFVFDDLILITHNDNLHDLAGLWRCWSDPSANQDFYPLTFTTWWIEYHLWGLWSVGFHFDNVVLHAGSVVLLFAILRRLGMRWAWAIAMVFAVHPVQVESVVWAAQRKNVLSGLLIMMSAWFFLSFWMAREESAAKPQAGLLRTREAAWWRYGAALVLFVFAMLAKPVVMTMAAGLAIVMWWKRGGRLARRDVALVLPFFVLLLPMAALTLWVQRHHVGATGEAFALTVADRVLVAGRALAFYLGKLLLPAGLCFAYPRWELDAGAWRQWLFPAGTAVALIAAFALRRRLGAGVFAGLLFFVAMLSPALGFVNIYWFRFYYVVDHMQYLAMIGIASLAVTALGGLIEQRLSAAWKPRAGLAIAAVVFSYVGLCLVHGLSYVDAETVWRDSLARNERSWLAHSNLASLLADKGDVEGTLREHLRAAELNPDAPEPYKSAVGILTNRGEFDRAAALLEKRSAARPHDAMTRVWLGDTLTLAGRDAEAKGVYARAALLIKPEEVDANPGATTEERASIRCMLGMALAGAGRLEDADREFVQAASIMPTQRLVHYQRARVLLRLERIPDAVEELRRQLSMDPPEDVDGTLWHETTLALALSVSKDASAHDLPLARRLMEEACVQTQQRAPRYMEALGLVAAAQGDRAAADAMLRAAENLAARANFSALSERIAARRAAVLRGEAVVLTGAEIVTQ